MNVIIVLNYNDYQTTIDFLDHFGKFLILDKIIVVDNFSTDDSFRILQKYSSEKIDVIRTEKNGGYTYGNAAGVEYALDHYQVDKIFISNPDILANENCLIRMAQVLDEYQDAGIVSCLVNAPLYTKKIPSAWKLPKFKDCLSEFLPSKFQSHSYYEHEYFLSSKIVKVDVIPGSLFAMRSDVYRDIGGFDTRTFLYYEENILAFQLRRHGYSNYIFTQLSYEHFVSQSINKSQKSFRKRLKCLENSREYYCKQYLNINKVQMMFLKVIYTLFYITIPTIISFKDFIENKILHL